MSRLDSFIRRLTAQRACLEAAFRLIADRPGPVLELGLGNGRTYDHLRSNLADREIFVFERQVLAHPDCVPDDTHLFLGDFHDTIPDASSRIGAPAVLAHCDIGSGDAAATAALAGWLGPALVGLLGDGAIVLADQPLQAPGLTALALPETVAPGRYHMYRHDCPAGA